MRFILKLFIGLIVMVLALGALVKLRDVSLQRKLTGTWVAEIPNGARSQWTIEPDGSYSAQLTLTNGNIINLEGTTKVKYGYMHVDGRPRLGFLIADTITKSNKTNATVPYVAYDYIAKLTDRELVIIYEYSWWGSTDFRKMNHE